MLRGGIFLNLLLKTMIIRLIIMTCVINIVGVAWQFNIAFDAAMNGWDYRWLIWTFSGLGIYDALDIMYGVVILSAVVLALLAYEAAELI